MLGTYLKKKKKLVGFIYPQTNVKKIKIHQSEQQQNRNSIQEPKMDYIKILVQQTDPEF